MRSKESFILFYFFFQSRDERKILKDRDLIKALDENGQFLVTKTTLFLWCYSELLKSSLRYLGR